MRRDPAVGIPGASRMLGIQELPELLAECDFVGEAVVGVEFTL